MRTSSPFLRSQPAALRAWHWLNAVAISGLLLTVLLRKTVLSWRTNSAYIEAQLRDAGTTITPELAKAIAVGIRAPMWEWHYVLGFGLAGLLVLRLVVAALLPSERPLAAAARALGRVASGGEAAHFAVVKAGYVVFYLMAAFMAVTGLLMYFEGALGLSKALAGSLKEVHEAAMWFFVAFVAVHLVGVVVAELRGLPGLVSSMISGGRPDRAARQDDDLAA